MTAPKDERVLPTWELLQRAKSEPVTDDLIREVKQELANANASYQATQADKKLRVNEGLGFAALRGVWARDAMAELADRLVEEERAKLPTQQEPLEGEAPPLDPFGAAGVYDYPKPKNNPTGIKAPKCPRCKRGAQ